MSEDQLAARLAQRRAETDAFRARWLDFVRAWRRAVRQGPDAAVELVTRVLREGLSEDPLDGPEPSEDMQVSAARAVVAASGYLDVDQYGIRHRLRRGADAARHHAETGWRLLQNPSPRFDLWSYWVEHLDPTSESVDPLLHWLLWGRHHGIPPVPQVQATRVPAAPARSPRRICFFAAHDRDGLVDDYVVTYLAELSRHADVYYLADGVLEPGQLDRLADVAKGAWSVPHGGYDFGSFSLLARDFVGWDVIDTYDELMLANDSCFLLRPLDDVLAAMDARACDWWSLQATSMEHDEHYLRDDSPIPLDEAKQRFVGPRKWSDVHYLHLSSYFLVFRRPVLDDEGFRWRLDTVVPQATKGMVVHKYEVGLSRYLTDSGFDFESWLDGLHAFHPLYSRHVFDHIASGFPMVKRNFLGENPRRAPGVGEWRQRLPEIAPEARVDEMSSNIERVTDPARSHDAHAVSLDPSTGRRSVRVNPLPVVAFKRLDRETPTHPHWWAFVVSPSGRLDPGLRAVLEEVRDDPSLRKVVLTRTRQLSDDVRGAAIDVVPLETLHGQEALARCGTVLVNAAPDLALPGNPLVARRRVVHVGGGTVHDAEGDWSGLYGVATAGHHEALVRAATTTGLSLDRLWQTGLPRHDLLVSSAEELPGDVHAAEVALRRRLDGRPLAVWWTDGRALPYDAADVALVGEWAERHGIVVGVREPFPDRAGSLAHAMAPIAPAGLSDRSIVSPVVVLRAASVIVTDSAPVARDAMVAATPLLLHRAPAPGAVWADQVSDGLPRHDSVAELLAVIDRLACDGFVQEHPTQAEGTVPVDGLAARRLVERIRSGR